MTYTNQPVVNIFQYTEAEEAHMEALSAEAEEFSGTYAYDGKDATLIPADLVKDAEEDILGLRYGWNYSYIMPGMYA